MNIPERWWRKKRQAAELTRLNLRLNNLGSTGWELIAYQATPMTGAFTQNIKGYAYLALFKQQQPGLRDDTSSRLEEEPAVQSEYRPEYAPPGAPLESRPEPEPQEAEQQPVDVMPDSIPLCEHAYCDQPAEPEKPFCEHHLEELRLLFAAIEIRCLERGNVALEAGR